MAASVTEGASEGGGSGTPAKDVSEKEIARPLRKGRF